MAPKSRPRYRSPSGPFNGYSELCLNELPFKRFENYLKSSTLAFATNAEADRENFEHNSLDTWLSGHEMADVSVVKPAMSLLSCLVPGEPIASVVFERPELISRDKSLSVAIRPLLFSIMNGFAGLDGTLVPEVLEYLHQEYNIENFLSLALKPGLSHAAKAFAENLLVAAINSRDKVVVEQVLSSHLVDVNTGVRSARSSQYTLLEQAALVNSPGIMRLLLNAGAYPRPRYNCNPSIADRIKAVMERSDCYEHFIEDIIDEEDEEIIDEEDEEIDISVSSEQITVDTCLDSGPMIRIQEALKERSSYVTHYILFGSVCYWQILTIYS